MAATPSQNYWLHHQVWEAWVPSQRSGPSAPPWCHRSYYYWYCCLHAVILYSLGQKVPSRPQLCLRCYTMRTRSPKSILCVGAVELSTSQRHESTWRKSFQYWQSFYLLYVFQILLSPRKIHCSRQPSSFKLLLSPIPQDHTCQVPPALAPHYPLSQNTSQGKMIPSYPYWRECLALSFSVGKIETSGIILLQEIIFSNCV